MVPARFRSLSLAALAVLGVSCSTPRPTEPEPAGVASIPSPTPPPAAAPRAAGCGVGPGTGTGQCPRTGSSFLPVVNEAINRVGAKHPELFDFSNQVGRDGWYVKNIDAYYVRVAEQLRELGYCAKVDGGNEIAVKKTNDFNDQYHIMISSRHVRRGEASYRATCTPAWF